MLTGGGRSPAVVDVTDQTFEKEVLERSKAVPVVVDFWAPWCEPCRTLGPILESLARERAGDFVLAKVNVDENPGVARAAGVQSIPLVLGVRDGQVVSEFVGAQPLGAIQQFLARLLPGAEERIATKGEELLAEGDLAGAEAAFRKALDERPGHARASLGLGRILGTDGRVEEAVQVLEAADGAGPPHGPEIAKLLAELRTGAADVSTDEPPLRERIARNPGDLEARLELGKLLVAGRRYEEGLEQLLDVVKRDRTFQDDAARLAMIDVFTLLGRDHPVASRFQRELSGVLFR
jgi:putative thioredoxin